MNTRKGTYQDKRRIGGSWVLKGVMILMLGLLLTGCPGSPPAAEVVGLGYEVREDKQSAWASIVNHNDLTILDDLTYNVWTDLLEDGYVTTDNTGIAELRNLDLNPDCTGLYVFKDSGVQLGSCTKSASGSWNCVVGAAASSSCNVGLASPSVDITLNSWVSLIALDNGALSLVTVLEGSANAIPVTQLDYKYDPAGEHGFILSFTTRVLDESQAVGLVSGESTFTASDDYLAMLPPSIAGMARTRLDRQQFQFVVNELLPLYPLLPGYIEAVSLRALQDNLLYPITIETTFLLEGLGDTPLNDSLQQVVLQGVDWKVLQEELSVGQPVRLAFSFPSGAGLLAEQDYNPDFAYSVAKEAGLGETFVTLMVPAGDIELLALASRLVETLGQIGVQAGIKEEAPDMFPQVIEMSAAAGTPLLWLTRP